MQKTYKNYTIIIVQNEYPLNPVNEFDLFGKFALFHQRYDLPNTENIDIEDAKSIYASNQYISLSVFMFEHSGVTINTTGFHCPWDSGQIGIIYVSKQDVRREYNVKRISAKLYKRVISALKSSVQIYDDYLTGNVYKYDIIDNNGVFIDSCWGFYGNDFESNGLLENARNAIDYHIETRYKTLYQN